MLKKIGRRQTSKTCFIHVRITSEEKNFLNKIAKQQGLSFSEFVRQVLGRYEMVKK
jgi:predicted HicB family RNase H-like nuclease